MQNLHYKYPLLLPTWQFSLNYNIFEFQRLRINPMAHNSISRSSSSSSSSTRKPIIHHHVLIISLFSLFLIIQKGNAYQFKVGGSGTWSLPSDPNANSYNQWAEHSRFQIGDTLLFIYSGDKDSVLLVNKDDYTNCKTDNPVKKFTDGHTELKLDHSGPYYLISGVKENCNKNEKLHLPVMADRSKAAAHETTTTPPPPSPAPSGEEAPSPPEVETNPTSAPSDQTNHKNGASSIVKSFIAPMGAFVGSCLLMLF